MHCLKFNKSHKKGDYLNYIFIDTEFTNLWSESQLISLALVCGYRRFYCELTDTYAEEDVSNFVYDCVLPFLDAPKAPIIENGCVYTRETKKEAQALLLQWLMQFKDDQATIVTDTHYYDFMQLQELLGKDMWPGYLDKAPLLVSNTVPNLSNYHHALDDAINLQNHKIAELLKADEGLMKTFDLEGL